MLSAQSAGKCQLSAFSLFATSHRLGSLLAPITLPLPLPQTVAHHSWIQRLALLTKSLDRDSYCQLMAF